MTMYDPEAQYRASELDQDQARRPEPTIYVITRDGQPVDQTEEPMRWFHANGPQSMEWQLRYEGYSIEGPFSQDDLDASEQFRRCSCCGDLAPDPMEVCCDKPCDCSHATIRPHPASRCSWDLAESRVE